MKRLLCLLPFLLNSFASADDVAVGKQLDALGGKVVSKDGTVTEVTFTDCSKLGNPEFREIGKLTSLKKLTLYGGCRGLNDETLPHLAGLKELDSLATDGAQLSDEGLKHLTALKSLRQASFFHLSFRKEGFTGTGFRYLKDCPKLEVLTVAGMSMGDDGFAAIAEITQLKQLSTWHTYQTEVGNSHIAKLPNLKSLKVGQRLPRAGAKAPSLSDESLKVFAGIPTLETLKIGEAHFTRIGLQALKSAKALKQLQLYETDFPESELPMLKADLIGIAVELQPLTEDQRKKLEMYLKQ